MSGKDRFSWSAVDDATRRARATGALQPMETRTSLIDDGGVRFVVRTVSSLVRKDEARRAAGSADPLGEYDPDLFVADVTRSHYVLLNKFPVVAGHVLLVTRRFERQESLLAEGDFAALGACLAEMDGLAFYNGGVEAGASQSRKHLQLVPLPLAPESPDEVPIERLLAGGRGLPFRHAFATIAPHATVAARHALYRRMLDRCGITAVGAADAELQSAPYNLLVRRGWMLLVPRSRERFESIAVNALGFAGSFFVRRPEQLEHIRACGPMRVLRAVAMPGDAAGEPPTGTVH